MLDARALRSGPLVLLGRLTEASNAVFLGSVEAAGEAAYVVVKPVAGERPLWDFPDGTLAAREVATSLVDAAGGWGLVPPTVWRESELGPGSVQLWVGPPPVGLPTVPGGSDLEVDGPVDPAIVDVVAPEDVRAGWLPVLEAEPADGRPVVLAHADDDDLRSLAVLDAALNNTDRKGSHILRDEAGRLWGIDHGVNLHADDKLRTILWGWAGEPLPEADVARLRRLRAALSGPLREALAPLLTPGEIAALTARVDRLLASGVHPRPTGDWQPIPWPPL